MKLDPYVLERFAKVDAEVTVRATQLREARQSVFEFEKAHDAIQRDWSEAYEALRKAIREAYLHAQ